MSWLFYAFGALLAGTLALLYWMTRVEPRRFRVRDVRMPARDDALPPLRVLHITDTHFHGRDGPMLAFLNALARQQDYDLVFYTGDLIHCADGIPALVEAVSLFEPRLGSYAVLGGHDYIHVTASSTYWQMLTLKRLSWACRPNPVERLTQELRRCGVTVLSDENVRVQCPDGRRLTLVGLRDAFQFEPDFETAWYGVGAEEPAVVLAHSPDVLPEVVRRGAVAVFCGHTHGGQIRLPALGALVTRSRLPRKSAWGAFRCRDTSCVVSCGLGVSPSSPYRLLCPPEVVVAQLGDDGPANLPRLNIGKD